MPYQLWDEYRLVGLGYELWIERGPVRHEEAKKILTAHFGECWKSQLDDEDASGLDGFVTSFVHDLTEYWVYRVYPEIGGRPFPNLLEQTSV